MGGSPWGHQAGALSLHSEARTNHIKAAQREAEKLLSPPASLSPLPEVPISRAQGSPEDRAAHWALSPSPWCREGQKQEVGLGVRRS